jgi:hypothetical protein
VLSFAAENANITIPFDSKLFSLHNDVKLNVKLNPQHIRIPKYNSK